MNDCPRQNPAYRSTQTGGIMTVQRDFLFEDATDNALKKINMAQRVYTSDRPQAKELLGAARQDIMNALTCLSIEKPSVEAIAWARKKALEHDA